MVAGALLAEEYITIHNACLRDLNAFICQLKQAGVSMKCDFKNDIAQVYRSENLQAVSIQTNIFPGFPTDLQAIFSVLMTQASGMSTIHEVLFEGRLNFLVELEKM